MGKATSVKLSAFQNQKQQDMLSFIREINQIVGPTVKPPAEAQEPPYSPSNEPT